MTQFLASRSMENFFINPTMNVDTSMETFARISIVTEPTKLHHKFEDFPLSEAPKEGRLSRSPSTIQDFFLNSNYLSSYHSEEESASPTDSSDSASIHSYVETPVLDTLKKIEVKTPSEPATALDLFLKPEELANSCQQIEHRCNRAQAVALTLVGKPKVVAIPKVVESGTPGSTIRRVRRRSSNESLRTASTADESARHTISRKSTVRSVRSTNTATSATTPASPTAIEAPLSEQLRPEGGAAEEQTPSRAESVQDSPETRQQPVVQLNRPRLPLLRAKTAFEPFPKLADIAMSARSPSKRSLKSSIGEKGSQEEEDEASMTPRTPAKRRLHKLASSFSLSNTSDVLKRTGSIASLRKISNPLIAHGPTPGQDSPRTPKGLIPRRSSSMGRLTPRGATERAPVLVLPPFPDEDEDDDDDFATVSHSDALQRWDRPTAKQAAKIQKTRPSIDGIVRAAANT